MYYFLILLTIFSADMYAMCKLDYVPSMNSTCPAYEKVILSELNSASDDYFFNFPSEMLKKADKTPCIKVKVATFRLLEQEALQEYYKRKKGNSDFNKIAHLAPEYATRELTPQKISCINTKLFSVILCLKQLAIPLDIIKLITQKITHDDEMLVSEADIVNLAPFLRYSKQKSSYVEDFPTLSIKINGKFQTIACQETAVIFDYQYYKNFICNGWIRYNDLPNNKNCNGKEIIWYLPQYFYKHPYGNNYGLNSYLASYGPRFREIIDGQEKSQFKEYGDVWQHYDFEKDPLYNRKVPEFLKES